KAALALLWERRHEAPAGTLPVLAAHDELVVEADEASADRAAAWLRQAMLVGMQSMLSPIPCEVEVQVGRTWAGQPLGGTRAGRHWEGKAGGHSGQAAVDRQPAQHGHLASLAAPRRRGWTRAAAAGSRGG